MKQRKEKNSRKRSVELMNALMSDEKIQNAHRVIRSLRGTKYFDRGDMFASWIAWVFASPPELPPLLVDMIIALDSVFENATSDAHRKKALQYFDSDSMVGEPDDATPQGSMELIESIKIVFKGIENCAGQVLPSSTRSRYLEMWREKFNLHNAQQLIQCRGKISWEHSGTVNEALDQYLCHVSCTIGLGFLLTGTLLFNHTQLDIDMVQDMIDITEPLMRLTADVIIDPEESLNAGIAAYCSQYKVTPEEARNALKHRKTRSGFQKVIFKYWRKYLIEAAKKLAGLAKKAPGSQKLPVIKLSLIILVVSLCLTPVVYLKNVQ